MRPFPSSHSSSLTDDDDNTVFIAEITARAFIVADSNKRRTLSRADIAKALSKSDQFDFLIDIVPRDEANFGHSMNGGSGSSGAAGSSSGTALGVAGTAKKVGGPSTGKDHSVRPCSLPVKGKNVSRVLTGFLGIFSGFKARRSRHSRFRLHATK